jgi:hypothetical protein
MRDMLIYTSHTIPTTRGIGIKPIFVGRPGIPISTVIYMDKSLAFDIGDFSNGTANESG